MNGLRTRNTLHTAWREDREQPTRLDSFEAMLAKICAVGLVMIIVVQIIEMVAA